MNKNLHDTDKFFQSAYQHFEEMPSPAVWEKLNAELDKKEKDKKGFIWWKMTGFVLPLLLGWFILSDTGGLSKQNIKHDKESGKKLPAALPFSNLTDKETVAQTPMPDNENRNLMDLPAKKNVMYALPLLYTPIANIIHNDTRKNEYAILVRDVYGEKEYDITKTSTPVFLFSNIPLKNINELKEKPLVHIADVEEKKRTDIKISPKQAFNPFWQISLFASYEQAGYKLDSDDAAAISNIRHSEVHEPSFSGGILVTKQFAQHWALQTGLIYSHTAIGISPQKIYAFEVSPGDIAYKYITSSGYAYIKSAFGSSPAFGDSITAESKHTIKSVNIPLSVQYKMGNKKLSVSPGAGIEANFVTSVKAEVELTDASNHETAFVNKLSGSKKLYWSGIAHVQVQYQLGKKTSLLVQPAYRYALSSSTKNNVLETFPRSFGIRAGFTIKF